MKMKFPLTIIVSVAFLTPFLSGAQGVAPSKNVTFTVSVGDYTCHNGVGQALVKFQNTPTEGGYYSVTGEMITKNNISLDREVVLPSGTYAWEGITQIGYSTSSPSAGTFTIKECLKDNPTPIAPVMKKIEAPKINEVIKKTETSLALEKKSTTTLSSSSIDISSQNTGGAMKNRMNVILFVVALIVGFFVIKRLARAKKSTVV